MQDNPALSPQVIRRYERMYTGRFYERFVLGEWVNAEGLVYDFFSQDLVREPPLDVSGPFYVSCDYGTVNPTSMGLWGRKNGVWYRLEEYYYNSRQARRQKTDQEYADDLEALVKGRPLGVVVVDPSAASFMEVLRRRGFPVRKANNDVLSGIRLTAQLLKEGKLVICSPCRDAIREFGAYCWDLRSGERDKVKKVCDHAMDEIRYFVATIVAGEESGAQFFVGAVERRGW